MWLAVFLLIFVLCDFWYEINLLTYYRHSSSKAPPFSPPSLHSDMAQTLLLLHKETVQIHGLHLHSVDENYLPLWVILGHSEGGKYLLMCNAGAATSLWAFMKWWCSTRKLIIHVEYTVSQKPGSGLLFSSKNAMYIKFTCFYVCWHYQFSHMQWAHYFTMYYIPYVTVVFALSQSFFILLYVWKKKSLCIIFPAWWNYAAWVWNDDSFCCYKPTI